MSTYASQGVRLNTKHVEVIIKQMLRNVKVEDSGDTDLLAGEMVDIARYEEENEKTLMNGGIPATVKRQVLGITKAALYSDSFLSAASFQETSRVLTDAAVKGKIDYLRGIKENVIIGKPIPAGTGFKTIRDTEPIDTENVTTSNYDVDDSVAKFFNEAEENI